MLRTITLAAGQAFDESILARSGGISAEITESAERIVDDVRLRGDQALFDYTLQFDKANISQWRVTDDELAVAFSLVDDELVAALRLAADRIEAFHKRQVTQSWFCTDADGAILGQQVTPLERVGIYVPGGRAQYPSSVLMNAMPAKVAGVTEIAMVAPPSEDGTIAPVTLVAAMLAGVTEIYKVGGAQAIGALAYGTESIRPVDKIVGPGNAFVAAAKRYVMGQVGIDMIAGPSEVLVLADATSSPEFIAIDLMAQAEHDPRAATYLVTTDDSLPELVAREIASLLTESSRPEVTESALRDNSVAIVCETLDDALRVANTIAPEHLEVHMDDPFELLGMIKNAGAIFLGPWTPESVGDYIAGPNHVLPTGSTARFSSPLSVDDFVKKSSVLSYSLQALYRDAQAVDTIAQAEGLWAHGRAVTLRLDIVEAHMQGEHSHDCGCGDEGCGGDDCDCGDDCTCDDDGCGCINSDKGEA